MSFLTLRNIHISYGKNEIFRNFNFTIEEGSIYVLIGPSGCGKSTLLKTICGIIQPDKGEILLKGTPLEPKKYSLGYIPQHYGLLDWLTVEENLSLGEKIKGEKSPLKEKIIDKLEMRDCLDKYPRELSGGQRQRTALARAWIIQPDLLLMDEPFSSLDAFTAQKSRDLFLQLWKSQKITTLFVTHNLQEAVCMGKYIVFLSKQPSEILKIIENPLFQKGVKPSDEDRWNFEQQLNQYMNQIWRADE